MKALALGKSVTYLKEKKTFMRLRKLVKHSTMRRLSSRNSSGLLVPGDILKNQQKYLIRRHFFKLTTRRKIEKKSISVSFKL